MATAPKRGTKFVEVGLREFWRDLREGFIDITRGTTGGSIIYVMGDYGGGKTFLCSYTREQVRSLWDHGFATSYIEVRSFDSLVDFVAIYRQIVKNIRAPTGDSGLEKILLSFVEQFPNRQQLNQRIAQLNLEPDFAQKIRFLWTYAKRDEERSITMRWIMGESGLQADLLHYIAEKGFAKLEEDEVDDYLTGIKRIIQDLGAEGLFIFIDEAEQRTAQPDPTTVRRILVNIKRLHNNVNTDERYSQTIFLLAGTRDLWVAMNTQDEAMRQRMQIQRDIPRLNKAEFVALGLKVARVYDIAFGCNASSRLSEDVLEGWVDHLTKGAIALTPRDFLTQKPTNRESFLAKLELMRLQPELSARNAFATT